MKKTIFTIIILFCAAAGFPQLSQYRQETPAKKLDFTAPTLDAPRYIIRFPLVIEDKAVLFKYIDINGVHPGLVQMRRMDRPVDLKKAIPQGIYFVTVDFAWKSKAEYKVTLTYDPQGGGKEKTDVITGTSPDQGGIPDACQEGFYRILTVEETAGFERKSEVAYTTLTTPKADIESQDLSIWDNGRALPFQVLETRESEPQASQAPTYPVTLTSKLAFAIDCAPRQKKMLIVLKGAKGSATDNAFTVSGDGPGKTVASPRFKLQLHPQSGQINVLEYLKENLRLHNEKAGVIHASPDVFVPGLGWDHAFDWNPPQTLVEKNGPVVYVNARKGPFPHVKDIELEVKYTLEKDAPTILVETMMTAVNDTGVIALRNDGMVFYKRLFDSLVFKDAKDGLIQRPMIELGDAPDGIAHIAPADAEWVGLVNSLNRYGFFSVRVSSIAANLDAAGDFLHKAGTYFYAPFEGEYVQWVRPLLYTWGEAATKLQLTFLPKGSFFYEKNAYLLLPFDATTAASLDGLAARLKTPLRVF
jgi:hypothetical protein